MKEYIKQYEKMREDYYNKWGEYHHPLSLQDFDEMNQKIYKEFLEKYDDSSNKVVKTELYIDILLVEAVFFNYYVAFCEGSFDRLNDALWQNGRIKLLSGSISSSGVVYTSNIINGLLACFACNDFEIIELYIPEKLHILSGTFYTENMINIFHSIYYKDDEKLEAAILVAEKFLTKKKNTGLAEHYVRFFIALARKDALGISEYLQKLCVSCQKQGYPTTKIEKCFLPEIHGLYHLVRFFDKGLFDKVTMPENKSFLKEFEEWQQDNAFPKGKLFFKYPKDLNYANMILESPLPTVKVEKDGQKFTLDVEQFANDLTYKNMK